MNRYDKTLWKIPGLVKGYINPVIQEFIKDAVLSGVLRPGEKILPYRTLALHNNVHSSAVSRAYLKLSEQGWLRTKVNSGTYIASDFPNHETIYPSLKMKSELPFKLKQFTAPISKADQYRQDYITIGFNTLSPEYFPVRQFSNYLDEKCKYYHKATQMDQVIDLQGYDYKECLLDYLMVHRDMPISAEHLQVTYGRKDSLVSVCRILLAPGDVVVNTSWRDPLLNDVLERLNVASLPMEMSGEAFIQKLEDNLNKYPIKAVFIRPQCSYAESRTLPPEQCEKLIELARRYQFYILEEDDHHEFWYNLPYKPLIRYDHGGHVIYLGAVSLLHPYLQNTRTLIAVPEIIEAVRARGLEINFCRDLLAESAFIQLIKNGLLKKFIRLARFEKKRHLFQCQWVMSNYLKDIAQVEYPETGLSVWVVFQSNEALVQALRMMESRPGGVPYHPESFKPEDGATRISVGFGSWDPDEAEQGAKDLIAALQLLNGQSGTG